MSKENRAKQKWWQGKLGCAILLVSIGLVFLGQSRSGGLLNYDDERYIAQNELIKSVDAASIGKMFSSYFDGHYHPVTIFSLALDRVLFQDEVKGHHSVNLLFHILNAVLVYLFLLSLFRQQNLAFSVALLFLLHPMNVESFAWMTERKNVLYSSFFLLASLSYLNYQKDSSNKLLLLCFLLFCLSILSKAQAMTFIPVMFLIDYFNKRDLRSMRVYLEKLPFILLAVAFVVITTGAQREEWGDLNTTGYDQIEKLALASFAFMSYLVKGLVPYDLSAYYPYPSDYGAGLEWYVYASIGGILIFIGLLWRSLIKQKPILLFGLAFFLINIILMLKYLDVPYGNYYMANRYNYLPLMGLLIIPVYYLNQWVATKKFTIYLPVAIIALAFGLQANARITVWNNSVSLWTDVLNHYPDYSHGLNMRALGNISEGRNTEAIQDFEELIRVDPDFAEAYLNLAVLNYKMSDPNTAQKWVNKALNRFPEDARFHYLSATIRLKNKDLNRALLDINQAIAKNADVSKEYALTKAQILIQLGRTEEAIPELKVASSLPKAQQLLRAIQAQKQKTPESEMLDRATSLAKEGRLDESLTLFDQVIDINPQNKSALINRGSTYGRKGEFEKALKDFIKASEIDPADARVFYLLGVTYRDMGKKNEACENYAKALQLGWDLDSGSREYCSN